MEVDRNVDNKKISDKVKLKQQELEPYPDISNTSSACECTGLMHAPPQSEEELESYQELSSMQIPKKQENK